MKPRKNRFILNAASALFLAPTVFAADSDGTWSTTVTPSSWATDTNWTANTIADGTGFTANFSILDITADTTVTLDGPRTIGNLIFGDTITTTAGSWIVATGTGGPLTLAAGLLSPNITVNGLGTNKNATITANLEGTNGLTKTGTGPLNLNFAPTPTSISGAIVLSQGNLVLSNRSLTNATSVAINAGTFVVGTSGLNAIGGTISFNGGTFQYNQTPVTDYSSQFSTDANQQYRITVFTGRTATFSTPLTSAGGFLLKDGQGNLTLDAANTFTGSTRVFSIGTLTLSNALALQNSPLDTGSSAAGNIVLSGVTSPTFGGLTGNKQLSTMFNASGNYGSVTNVTLNPGTGASYSYDAVLDNGAAGMTLTKTGGGTQTLTAANTYSGGTILSGGILNYGNASALSSGPISFTGNSTLQAGVGIATTLANAVSVASGITGTMDTNGNTTTLSGALTGDGNFTKSGTGSLTLSGGLANTLTGAININAGNVQVTDGLSITNMPGTITVASGAGFYYSKNFASGNNLPNAIILSGPGTGGSFGALNLYGNVNATGPITLAADATISHSFNNATISNSITGTDRNLTLRTTESGQPGLVISAPISLGTGGITVQGVANSGLFSIKLSGNNSYTGETRVVSGTLMLSGNARIGDTAAVRIDSGAVLHLDFAGTDTVGALYLPGDPNPKPNGTYGSLTSLADNKSADFAGDGILQVGGAANNYASWAASQTPPVAGGPNGDDDGDGVNNLVEYALVDGGERGVLNGSILTFTKRGAPYGGDITYAFETSTDLGVTDSWETAASGVTEDSTSISYQFTPGSPARNFARLKVLKAP